MKTIRDLKAFLETIPEEQLDARVDLEGCDCIGRWAGTGTIARDEWSDPKGQLTLTLTRDHS